VNTLKTLSLALLLTLGLSARAQAQEWTRRNQDFEKRFAAATGSICGKVIREAVASAPFEAIGFLSTVGHSPVEHPTAELNPDGTFCSPRLGPGSYLLHLVRRPDEWHGEPDLTSYYPGVDDRAKATVIDVGAGQTRSGILFRITALKKYTVRGLISVQSKSGPPADSVIVNLMNADGASANIWHRIQLDLHGFLPHTFTLDNVQPGRYIAYVSGAGQGWSTSKTDVIVTNHMKFIFLKLVHSD